MLACSWWLEDRQDVWRCRWCIHWIWSRPGFSCNLTLPHRLQGPIPQASIHTITQCVVFDTFRSHCSVFIPKWEPNLIWKKKVLFSPKLQERRIQHTASNRITKVSLTAWKKCTGQRDYFPFGKGFCPQSWWRRQRGLGSFSPSNSSKLFSTLVARMHHQQQL